MSEGPIAKKSGFLDSFDPQICRAPSQVNNHNLSSQFGMGLRPCRPAGDRRSPLIPTLHRIIAHSLVPSARHGSVTLPRRDRRSFNFVSPYSLCRRPPITWGAGQVLTGCFAKTMRQQKTVSITLISASPKYFQAASSKQANPAQPLS
jgi:hypothetical protein